MKGFPRSSMDLGAYAAAHAEVLMRRLAFQVSRTLKRGDAESIHDLRVAIRRLATCLETFDDMFPGGSARKVLRRVKRMRKVAGAVRDCDIVHAFLKEFSAGGANCAKESEAAAREMNDTLRRWKRREAWRKWGARLGL